MENLDSHIKGALSNFRRGFRAELLTAEEREIFRAFCHELDGVAGCVAQKYSPDVYGRAEARKHQLVQSYPMVVDEIRLIHKQILRMMRSNGQRKSLRIARDVPSCVFDQIRGLMTTNSFRTTVRETRTTSTLAITSAEKVVILFNFWGREEGLERNSLLRKTDRQGNKMSILVNESYPFTLKYHSNTKRLFLTSGYEVLNKYGIAQ
ncbi:uncharacterized protein LOC135500974 [Lineus longissimus]|uniref:uncharacterized protein LOC135500974 n=1 Tax=Lineus longissimus TaxID=88925 RepID=UPI00315DDF14